MKERLVRMIVARKFDLFAKSIKDEGVRKLVEQGTIVTGGCIASLLLNERVNDYDLYFKNKETAEAVTRYYLAEFTKNPPQLFKSDATRSVSISYDVQPDRIKIVVKSSGIASENGGNDYQYFEMLPQDEGEDSAIEYVATQTQVEGLDDHAGDALEPAVGAEVKPEEKRERYRPVFLTANAITLSDKVQLVVRFFGDPDEIHENYDFAHCMNYWTSWDRKLTLRPDAVTCLLTKDLRYIGSKYPICSLIRTRKFIARGWNINAGQFVKMAWQVSKLDLSDIKVLEEQLIGVDAAYFIQLLDALKAKHGERVDGAYLMTIIDRLF